MHGAGPEPHTRASKPVTICSTKVPGDKLCLSVGAGWAVGDKQVHKCLAQAGVPRAELSERGPGGGGVRSRSLRVWGCLGLQRWRVGKGWLPGLPPFLPSLSLLPEDGLLRQLGPNRGGQGAWAVSRLLRARSV